MSKNHSHSARGDKRRAERVSAVLGPVLDFLGIGQMYGVSTSFADSLSVPRSSGLPKPRERHVSAITGDGYPFHYISMVLSRPHVDNATDLELVKTVLHEILHSIPLGALSRWVCSTLGKDSSTDAAWICAEEEAVDLLAIWLARLWFRAEDKEAA